jgi:hypothetical protein
MMHGQPKIKISLTCSYFNKYTRRDLQLLPSLCVFVCSLLPHVFLYVPRTVFVTHTTVVTAH